MQEFLQLDFSATSQAWSTRVTRGNARDSRRRYGCGPSGVRPTRHDWRTLLSLRPGRRGRPADRTALVKKALAALAG